MGMFRRKNAAGNRNHPRSKNGKFTRKAVNSRGKSAYNAALKSGMTKRQARQMRSASKGFDRGTVVISKGLMMKTGAERGSYYARQQARVNYASGNSVAKEIAAARRTAGKKVRR